MLLNYHSSSVVQLYLLCYLYRATILSSIDHIYAEWISCASFVVTHGRHARTRGWRQHVDDQLLAMSLTVIATDRAMDFACFVLSS